jgi:mannose-6-phosphate isomerase-like protein (cupin superfamily)
VEPDAAATEPHYLDRDEVFMVVRGSIRLSPGADAVSAGDVAVVPAGAPIQLANAGDSEAEVIVAIPSGFVPTAADGSTIDTPPWAL